ncbi:MAG: hypothetical protein R3C01_03325 [Planctomycetaceae bacterium]
MFMKFEQLESRLLLTATATLSSNGTLLITGDAGDDLVLVVGTGAGTVDLFLNGDDVATPYSGVANITINTRGGMDDVNVILIDITGNLKINTGAGDDMLSFGADSQIGGNLVINMGSGNDEAVVGAVAGAFDVAGNLNIKLGSGTDNLYLGLGEITGKTTLNGGGGFDTYNDLGNVFTTLPKERQFEQVIML